MRRTQGFTIVELLVASVIALLLLLLVGSTLSSVLRLQAREDQNIPVQQALRGSIEAVAQELRDSIGPRVVYPDMNGTGSTVPAGLPLSSATSITILVPQANTTFVVTPPLLYPNTTSLLARTSSIITDGSLADTPAASQQCAAVFTGSDYGVFYSTLNTDLQTNAQRSPDAYRVFQTAATTPCLGVGTVTLNHPNTLLPIAGWNPNTYVVRVTPVTYYVSSNVLYRRLAGQAAQVVAFNISSMTLSYLPENTVSGVTNCSVSGVFTSVPGCTPRSVNLTLTSVPQSTAVKGARSLTASQIIFLR
jgi:type II secretory pathway pseudopilin PulG